MERKPLDRELTDGVVTLRPPVTGDSEILINGRDAEFHRSLGDGSPEPEPTAVVLNRDRQITGWIDYDVGREWLSAGEVNIGYNTFLQHRRLGLARRSIALLIEFLAEDTAFTAATLLIDPANVSSIAVADSAGFREHGAVGGELFFKLYAPSPRQ